MTESRRLAQPGDVLRRLRLEAAQLVERLDLGVQPLVGGTGRADDPAVHRRASSARPRAGRRRAAGGPRRLRACPRATAPARPRTRPRRRRRSGRGRRQLLLGGAHGIVHVDEGGAGAVREVVGGDVAELVALHGRLRRARPGRHRRIGPRLPPSTGSRYAPPPTTAAPPTTSTPTGTSPGPGLSAVRSPSARPTAAPAQSPATSRGSTSLVRMRSVVGHREREPVGDRDVVRAVTGGHREEDVLGAELGQLRGLVGPGLRGRPRRRVDVDDEEVDAVFGAQPLDRRRRPAPSGPGGAPAPGR